MRKLLFAVTILLAMTFAACGESEYEAYEGLYEAPEQYEIEELQEEIYYEPYIPEEPNASGRLKADYLEDFDYLFNALYESFTLFNATYRRHGVDMVRRYEVTRAQLEQGIIHNDNFFHDILNSHFINRARFMGHLSTLHASQFRASIYFFEQMSEYELNNPNFWRRHHYEALNNPASRAFYGVHETSPAGRADAGTSRSVVRTDILEEGRIAYISISRMSGHTEWAADKETIFNFYEEIRGFEHLIIDITGNGGGSSEFFTELIMRPNITEPVEFYRYWFIRASDRNMRNIEGHPVLRGLVFQPVTAEIMDNMPYLHKEDLNVLDYVVRLTSTIYPLGEEAAFDGKIWLLIDETTFSAADFAAALAKQTGFATLVGQNTLGGGLGIASAAIVLPNTGIIVRYAPIYATDALGRNNYEVGTPPHIFRSQGKTALETVLEIIEKEW